MKRALYVIMTLVLVVNLYSTYSIAAEADEKEDITNSFLEDYSCLFNKHYTMSIRNKSKAWV